MVVGISVLLQLCLVVMVHCSEYIDITVPVSAGMPTFQSSSGLPKNWRSQHQRMEEGDVCNQSSFVLDGEAGLTPRGEVKYDAVTQRLCLNS